MPMPQCTFCTKNEAETSFTKMEGLVPQEIKIIESALLARRDLVCDDCGGKVYRPVGTRMSLKQCREIAPELNDLTDEELLEARDILYELAQLAYEAWKDRGKKFDGDKENV